MKNEYFEKIKSFLEISSCVECVAEHSRYSIGCGIDVLIESSSTIGAVDFRYGEPRYAAIGVATPDQMSEFSAITIPKMNEMIESVMSALPV